MLKGKVIIITGAGSGIGRATAIEMSKSGARLCLADVNEQAVREAYDEIMDIQGEATHIKTDVCIEDDVANMVDHTLATFGSLDAAFNNAGIEGVPKALADIELSDFEQTIAVNQRGVFLCLKHEIRAMKNLGGGSIVNNSSVVGQVGAPGLAPYCASKHGVIGLTKTAALDYAHENIRVNAICPGGVETPMIAQMIKHTPEAIEPLLAAVPMKRLAAPLEIAKAVSWLCSDQASFLTGASLEADGGYLAR